MEAAAESKKPEIKVCLRKAEMSDVDWIFGELKKFSDFFGSKKNLFNDGAAAQERLALLINEHLVWVAYDENEGALGFIAGVVTPHLLNPNIKVLAELFWWVGEDYRGTRAGAMLFNKFMEWGKANVDWITFGLEHHSPVNEDSLIKRGFKLHEKSYLLEVE